MKLYSLVLALLCSTFLLAQNRNAEPITVTGKIIEEGTNIPLEYATVSFENAQGKVVNGGITNTEGVYSINIPRGLYLSLIHI